VNSVGFDAWPPREVKLARAMLPLTRHLPPGMILSIVRGDLLRGYADRDRGTRSVELYLRPFATTEGRDALMRHLTALDPRESMALAPRLKEISAPTTVVWGKSDPFLPVALGRRLQAAIAGASLRVVDNAGHFTPEEAPEPVSNAIAELLRR
jgi:pimeloyl-ACP methyl ester carboxylesterase